MTYPPPQPISPPESPETIRRRRSRNEASGFLFLLCFALFVCYQGGYNGFQLMLVAIGALGLLFVILVFRALYRVGEPRVATYLPTPTATATADPPPGWYLDPQGSGNQRWWNGTVWSDAVRTPPNPTV
ncbi:MULTISPECIES: DUF2510 domain-containing protein [Nocardia]|uniref:DUF2510 domain-containing protein n=1 Tax=Nocardia TaxID=1817 RepID=UPI000D69F6C6|nr:MULTISPECIES: DUF2510 domain-containing protein [Nocardia]